MTRILGKRTYRCDHCGTEEADSSEVLNWLTVRLLRDEVVSGHYDWRKDFCCRECLALWAGEDSKEIVSARNLKLGQTIAGKKIVALELKPVLGRVYVHFDSGYTIFYAPDARVPVDEERRQ